MTSQTRPPPLVADEQRPSLFDVGVVLQTIFRTARLAPEKADFRPALPLRSLPGLYGADMGKMTYREQLLHPNWQRKRLEVLESSGWACDACGTTEKTLHVHHKRYIKGRSAWEYDSSELSSLCEDCHEDEHDGRSLLDELIAMAGTDGLSLRQIVALVAAQNASRYALDADLEDRCRAYVGETFYMTNFVMAAITGRMVEATAIQALRANLDDNGEADPITLAALRYMEGTSA